MIEIRCSKCGRKLMECTGQAIINIKCPKCKEIITIKTENQERH